jgi:hypothetical protein
MNTNCSTGGLPAPQKRSVMLLSNSRAGVPSECNAHLQLWAEAGGEEGEAAAAAAEGAGAVTRCQSRTSSRALGECMSIRCCSCTRGRARLRMLRRSCRRPACPRTAPQRPRCHLQQRKAAARLQSVAVEGQPRVARTPGKVHAGASGLGAGRWAGLTCSCRRRRPSRWRRRAGRGPQLGRRGSGRR